MFYKWISPSFDESGWGGTATGEPLIANVSLWPSESAIYQNVRWTIGRIDVETLFHQDELMKQQCDKHKQSAGN